MLDTKEAARRSGRHPVTVALSASDGSLHAVNGRYEGHCVDAWNAGEKCSHMERNGNANRSA